jgi:hypothetical protein
MTSPVNQDLRMLAALKLAEQYRLAELVRLAGTMQKILWGCAYLRE